MFCYAGTLFDLLDELNEGRLLEPLDPEKSGQAIAEPLLYVDLVEGRFDELFELD